jgi:hypothetical protein
MVSDCRNGFGLRFTITFRYDTTNVTRYKQSAIPHDAIVSYSNEIVFEESS